MTLTTGQSYRFDYTGSINSIFLKAGRYKIQCAAAKGGGGGTNGSYVEGIYDLTRSSTFSICCGGVPSSWQGGYGYGMGSDGESGGRISAYGGGGGSLVICNNITIASACGGNGTDSSYTAQVEVQHPNSILGSVATNIWSSSGYQSCGSFYCAKSQTVQIIIATYNHSGKTGSARARYKVDNTQITDWGSNFSVRVTVSAGYHTIYCWPSAYSAYPVMTIYGITYTTETVTYPLAGGTGGGSNYLHADVTNTVVSQSNTGNGYVIITCLEIHSLIIHCKYCKINGYDSLEIISPGLYNIRALHSMVINNLPCILDGINIPGELVAYANIVSIFLVELLVDSILLSKGLELTVEATYHENIRFNSNFYKNCYQNTCNFLDMLEGIIYDEQGEIK